MAPVIQGPEEDSQHRSSTWWSRLPLWPAFALGGLVFVIWAINNSWWVPITSVDINQWRADTLTPVPRPLRQISQEFVASKDGLYQVELLLSGRTDEGSGAHLEIQLLDDSGASIAARDLESPSVGDQQPFTLTFSPQSASAGKKYTLLISGAEGNNASVWAYSLDVHDGGQLAVFGTETSAQDLRFVSRYQLSFTAAVTELGQTIKEGAGTILLALAVLLMPGCLLLQVYRFIPARIDPFAWLATAIALGASLWPLAWLWLTVVGGRWAAWSLWFVLISGWVATIVLLVVGHKRARETSRQSLRSSTLSWHHGALLIVITLGLAGRLLAVRDLAFPAWVDSSRHALLTTLMSLSGQTITSYQPLLPIEEFPYHFGFHTLSSTLEIVGDQALPQLLLILGQLLNGLVPLTIYGATYLFTRRRGAALFAAFLVALPFFFPAYYATWGRMTQVTAMLILPMALAFTWLLVRGAQDWRRAWLLVTLLAAGLFLVHFRVFLLYLPFVFLVWVVSRGRHGRTLALAGGLAMLLVSPHMIGLLGYVRPNAVAGNIPGYNQFPTGYVMVGWERAFLIGAALAGLVLLVSAIRRRRWSALPLLLLVWPLLVGALLSLDRLGLPATTLINLNSSYIVAFVPLALALAIVAQQVWRWLPGRGKVWGALLMLVGGAGLTAALLFGLRQQVNILNPTTILAWTADARAIAWLDENLPEEAKVAVNSWQWLGNTWAGSDGGAWIVPLTGRESTTPPADYAYDRALFNQVKQFNEKVATWSDWSDPAVAVWLMEQGVSYIYVGPKGGQFEPALLARNPLLKQVYGHDGAFIFAVQ